MLNVRFRFLGPPSAEWGTNSTPLVATRPHELLAHLAVGGGWQGRDHLAELFWPDRGSKIARSNLRNLLTKMAEAAPFATIESTQYALRLKVASDLDDLEGALRSEDWEAAAVIGAAELLEGLDRNASEPYRLWLRGEREARLAQWKKAVQSMLSQRDRALAARETLAQSWAARCPLDEDAVQARIALAFERHQPAAAARLFNDFATRLRDELGVRPSVELERLALQAPPRATSAGSPAPVAEPSTTRRTPAAARVQVIGRRFELKQLQAWLGEGQARLVTITGPGGVGKSTLLAACHQQWQAGGGTDALLVDVGAAATAQAVIVAIAAAVGATIPPGPGHAEALADTLGDRAWLLMIDGAEQAGIGTPLALLLERCPHTRWVIASRQRLHLDNEQLLVLDGFPVPDAGETDPDLLGVNDGVRFLADAIARSGQPVDLARRAGVMAALVRAVDGLPLALKLLGKMTHLFSLEQLLESVLEQPGSGSLPSDTLALAELLPSLLASVRRSWRSLSPAEQNVLARLAVFTTDFEITAARWVAQAELPVITSLVDRSLLRALSSGRLALHAAIRSCVQALSPQHCVDAIDDYIGYYTRQLRILSDQAKSRTLKPLRRFLHAEKIHVDRVWDFALERRDYANLLNVQEAVWFVDEGQGTALDFSTRCIEAERLLQNDPKVPPALAAMLQAGIAAIAFHQARLAKAADLARLAMRQAQRARHHDAAISALRTATLCSVMLRQFDKAEALVARMEGLLKPAPEGVFAVYPPEARGALAFIRGDAERCIEQYERTARLAGQIEDTNGELASLVNLALLCHKSNMPERAIGYEQQMVAIGAPEDADPDTLALGLSEISHWHVYRGDLARAQSCVERAGALSFRHTQSEVMRLKVLLGQAGVLTAQGRLAAAREHLVVILDAISREKASSISNLGFLVTAQWFHKAEDLEACTDVLRILRQKSAATYESDLLKQLLRELDDAPPDAQPPETQPSGDLATRILAAAAVAGQRMRQRMLPAHEAQVAD